MGFVVKGFGFVGHLSGFDVKSFRDVPEAGLVP